MLKILTKADLLEGAACSGAPREDALRFFAPDYKDDRPPGLTDNQWRGVFKSEWSERSLTVAARYCAGCPVRLQCLALAGDDEHGVYGGWSPVDRARGAFKDGSRGASGGRVTEDIGRLIRDGETIDTVAQKMKMPRQRVFAYLRSWLAIRYGE